MKLIFIKSEFVLVTNRIKFSMLKMGHARQTNILFHRGFGLSEAVYRNIEI